MLLAKMHPKILKQIFIMQLMAFGFGAPILYLDIRKSSLLSLFSVKMFARSITKLGTSPQSGLLSVPSQALVEM